MIGWSLVKSNPFSSIRIKIYLIRGKIAMANPFDVFDRAVKGKAGEWIGKVVKS